VELNEVAPPGFGHTKGDKEKGVKKGGTAAAFDRARKEGRFKGSKSDMFAIMWSQKNKGDKPHYKPGTDKKYKKYQKEETSCSYEKLKKKIGSKKMHDKPALEEDASYKDFTRKAREASDRIKKAKKDTMSKNAKDAFNDRVRKGIRFYDKKGSGRIKQGKKIYD